jgi:hypothetical protein
LIVQWRRAINQGIYVVPGWRYRNNIGACAST